MPKVGTLTIYSTRGGNGKTITSVMLAIAAAKRNLKTVIIDADLEAPSLMHLIKPIKNGHTWVDFLTEEISDVKLLPRQSVIENLDIIYSPTPKIGKAFLSWKEKEWWQQALRRSMIAIEELHENGYDLVVVDNQSGTSLNSVNNMVLADASVMVIRPATYGVGAAESFLDEMYRVLRGMKPRTDYYIWNQVQSPTNEQDKNILENFLKKWDDKMIEHGIINGGRIYFNPKLNLGLLAEEPNLIYHFDEVSKSINELLDLLLSKN